MPNCAVVEKVKCFVQQHGIDQDCSFLVAVSGGADSVGLLHGLLEVGFKQLIVCHLNHGLRGAESEGDEGFVRELAEGLNLSFVTKKVDVAAIPGSMETAAREARYDFFQEQVAKFDCQGVFLGHHADDQAETVLYNLCRGGLGLRGIKEYSQRGEGNEALSLYRPLLTVRKSEIEAYLVKKSQHFRVDSSNEEAVAVRNRIRNEVLPLLSEVLSREVAPLINKAAELSELRSDYITQSIVLENFLDPQGRLFLPKLQESHRFIQYEVLKGYLEMHAISQLSSDLLERASVLLGGGEISKLNLPGGKFLRRKEKRLFISE